MAILIILVIASVLVAVLFAGAFLWSATSGQYDDLHTPAVRMLLPDRPASKSDITSIQESNRIQESKPKHE